MTQTMGRPKGAGQTLKKGDNNYVKTSHHFGRLRGVNQRSGQMVKIDKRR